MSVEISPCSVSGGGMMSAHDMGAVEALRIAALRGIEHGRIVVVGTQPESLAWDEELSPTVERALGRMMAITRGLVAGNRTAAGAPEVVQA